MSKLKFDDGVLLRAATGKPASQKLLGIAAFLPRWDIGLAATLAVTVPFAIWAAVAFY